MSSENLLLFSWHDVKINEFYEIIVSKAIIYTEGVSPMAIFWQNMRKMTSLCQCKKFHLSPALSYIFFGKQKQSRIFENEARDASLFVRTEQLTAVVFHYFRDRFQHSFVSEEKELKFIRLMNRQIA